MQVGRSLILPFGRITLLAVIACLGLSMGWTSAATAAEPGQAAANPVAGHILVLYGATSASPISIEFERGLRRELDSRDTRSVEYYSEYLEAQRFGSVDASAAFHDYLLRKYSARPMDVVVAVTADAVNYMLKHVDLFPHTPIVFYGRAVSPAAAGRRAAEMTGVTLPGNFGKTLDAALELHPQTREVLVVSGKGPEDQRLERNARQEFARFEEQVAFRYLSGLPLDELLDRVAAATDGSLVIYVRHSQDERGQPIDPLEVLDLVSSRSSVPVYGLPRDNLGHGIVGGYSTDYEQGGVRSAQAAIRILRGERAGDIPSETIQSAPMFDWRQLQRWKVSNARLPAGSTISFRDAPLLERYRRYVAGGVLIVTVQLALIGGLLLQSRRRRRAEDRSRVAESRFRSVIDTQSELICRFLPDTTLTFVNDAYCRFWNKTRDELLGTRFVELIPPAERQLVVDNLTGVGLAGTSIEHQVTLPGGGVGWQHWLNHPVYDNRGRVTELQGVGRDVTEKKRAELALLQAESRNTAFLRAIPDMMFAMLADGTYIDYHVRDARMLFVPPDAFMGKRIRDVMPPLLAELFMEALARCLGTDEPVVIEYELVIGEPRCFEARLVRADVERVIAIVRETTEAKRADELNRDLAGRLLNSQEEERQRIARELHDDLSQKIALLNIEIDQMTQQVQPSEQRARLKEILGHAADIATDVHDLSHSLHPSKLQTLGLVSALESLCRDTSRQGGVPVSFSQQALPPVIDPSVSLCLYRITQEALHNVTRHSRATAASVKLTCDDGQYLRLHIADSGIGFDNRAARTRDGLGLISMRERVSFLRGQLVIHTAPGEGTRIGVRVPLPQAAKESASLVSRSA